MKANRETVFEIQLVADAGKKPNKRSSGAIFGALAATSNPTNEAKVWNAVEIALNEPNLRVTINGEVVQDIDISKTPRLPKLRPEGHIAFQYKRRKGKALYRNLRIKEL